MCPLLNRVKRQRAPRTLDPMPQRLSCLACTLVVLAALLAAAGDGGAEAPAPLAAFAVAWGNGAVVWWTTGLEHPDAYRVYGIADGSPHLLRTVSGDDSSVVLPDAYPSYAITAVSGTSESAPASAALEINAPCVFLDQGVPPDVYLGCGVLGTHTMLMFDLP